MKPLDLMAFGLGTQELVIIFVLILLLFGGSKIPQLMRSVGQGVGELQKGLEDGKRALESAAKPEPSTDPKDPR